MVGELGMSRSRVVLKMNSHICVYVKSRDGERAKTGRLLCCETPNSAGRVPGTK